MSSSVRLILILAVIAVSLSGWVWGFKHWQVASGAKFSDDELDMINLQDQLTEVMAENERLAAAVRELTEKAEGK